MFGVSALAKLGATVCTYPLLLVKARLQSAGKHSQLDRQYTGTADAIHRIWRTEGTPLPAFLRRLYASQGPQTSGCRIIPLNISGPATVLPQASHGATSNLVNLWAGALTFQQ